MGLLDGLSLSFDEIMEGWIGEGESDFFEGRFKGEEAGTHIRLDLNIKIGDLAAFRDDPRQEAGMTGRVIFHPLGGDLPVTKGVFNLFTIDAATGERKMEYTLWFTGGDEKKYRLYGFKSIKDDEARLDVIQDMTTLFTRIDEIDHERLIPYGAGEIFFDLADAPDLVSSIRVRGAFWPLREAAAKVAFLSLVYGTLRSVYLRDLNPFYETSYENLVLCGKVGHEDEVHRFFLVSGVHDKDFPWGDGEIFWDVLLVIEDLDGRYRKYCLTDRLLEGLYLDVRRGLFRYRGLIYELTTGYSTGFQDMKSKSDHLIERWADMEIRFQARPFATTPLPFFIDNKSLARFCYNLKERLHHFLPSEPNFGIHITPHGVEVREGYIRIVEEAGEVQWDVVPGRTYGEAESTTIRNIKEPTLLYNYICALHPEKHRSRVQIHSSTLRDERQHYLKDRLDALVGSVVSHVSSMETLIEGEQIRFKHLDPQKQGAGDWPCFQKQGDPILEVNNDHFPTAVFQRKIIEVLDPNGETCLALEEDMDIIRRESLNSNREVTVAAIKGTDKFECLLAVLRETRFEALLMDKWRRSGRPKEEFSIVIKPNFMFAYNKVDKSTYTDPELVHLLVEVILSYGFKKICVAEAQSTYGEYFTNREVKDVAEYLGYVPTGTARYELVDLTLDESRSVQFGPHLGRHPVPETWAEADFLISFAKNKTHCYAYYTLTLKNIYGALSMGNKFKEYHCDRDIYHTTIEYLDRYPVDYGLIDACLSADGPFGIFADSEPNRTDTIIGGADLVAVDWVGASKMGLDPMISRYMELAVRAFGKPKIHLAGDPGLYRPWLNMPFIMTVFTHHVLDADYTTGNILYMSGAFMDEAKFKHKSRSEFIEVARSLLNPIQKAVFLQTGGERTMANRILGRFLTWLGK